MAMSLYIKLLTNPHLLYLLRTHKVKKPYHTSQEEFCSNYSFDGLLIQCMAITPIPEVFQPVIEYGVYSYICQ